MLFVLSTLLGCKRKNEIQNNLAKLGIIHEMNRYFEYNEWGNIFEENPRPVFNNQDINYSDDTAFHGEGCKCDQEVGFKVQFLRFIYSFCCRDNDNTENKLGMFSKSDLEDAFANSFFYFFYVYLHMQKLRVNSQPKGNSFSAFCDKVFILERKMGNEFSAFFDFVKFENLFLKANNFCAEQRKKKEIGFSVEKSGMKEKNEDKDLILCSRIYDVEIIEEFKGDENFDNNFKKNFSTENTRISNSKGGSEFDNNKNLTFKTTKISKNHFNKGASGNLKLNK
jgi:hypothetical protein